MKVNLKSAIYAAVTALSIGFIFAPSAARAESCLTTVSFLRQAAANGDQVLLNWTTNFYEPSLDPSGRRNRFMAITEMELTLLGGINGDLVGSAERHYYYSSPVEHPGFGTPRTIALRIRPDGRIIFDRAYGPYEAVCYTWPQGPAQQRPTAFAIVNTTTAIEVLHFHTIRRP